MSLKELKRELGFARGVWAKRPYNVYLQVTNRCNMQCSFCDFPKHAVPPQQELSLDEFRRLSGELSGLGRFMVSIEGGEPFVRSDLVDIVRIFSGDHLPILYTNGWYVTPENVRALFDAGLAQVGVSVDFPDVRHDAKRGLSGAFERASRAVELFRDAAPHGGDQVHVMTVLTKENAGEVEPMLRWSEARGVGQVFTLLSTSGALRGKGVDQVPAAPIGETLTRLWDRYPHWKFFRGYLEKMDDFLSGREMPPCRAGLQTFNVDHVGNVTFCIEKTDRPVGSLRQSSLADLHRRLTENRAEVEKCQDCWTACRGFGQFMGGGPSMRSWWQLMRRMRSR